MKHKRLWLALGSLLICMIGVLATYHDATRYKQPLIQVTAVKTIQKTKTTDDYQNQDTEVQQKVTGRFLNTKRKGQTIQLQNTYSKSLADSYRYYRGQQVFLHHDQDRHQWLLNEPKRDTVLVAVILGTFSLLLVMMPKRG